MLSTFPSAKEHGDQTKGGIVLIKLKKPQHLQAENAELKMVVSYDDADGNHYSEENVLTVNFRQSEQRKGHYSSSAIRKAIALTRQASPPPPQQHRFSTIFNYYINHAMFGCGQPAGL